MTKRASVHVVLAVLLLAARPVAAQVTTGEIFGNVRDTSSAVLPGVTVTVEGTGLLRPMVATTSASGGYRFPNVPLGAYSVTFELAGFQRLVHTDIRIETGFSAEISPQLAVSGVQETVTVAGETPVVDTKSNTIGFTFNREMLEKLPSARDPWVVLEQMPGMVMDRQNVGGSESGQQSGFISHGMGTNEVWSLNGATVTDPEGGGSPMYFDFDSFEEIQIQTGGSDASFETGNSSINLVTKSGGNTLRGTSRLFWVNEAMQADNSTPELRAAGAGSGNPIHDIKDYGAEVGGPIAKDKAWFWGAAARNTIKVGIIGFLKPGATDPNDPDSLESDLTELTHYNGKLNYAWSGPHKSTVFYNWSNKFRPTRGADANTRVEAAVRQTSPGHTVQFDHQWVASDRLMLSGKFTYQGNHFLLDFTRPELADVQAAFDIVTGVDFQSGERTDNNRPTYESRLDANYFTNLLGGDHSMKFGVRYKRNPYSFDAQYGGGVIARFRDGVPSEAELRRDASTKTLMRNWSAWFNDSYRRGRATLNAGLRWDYFDDEAKASRVNATPIAPELLPALDFGGINPDLTFSDISPRVGLTYDLFGTGKTVLKASAARYLGTDIDVADHLNPVARTRLRFPWSDVNGDRIVQRSELDTSRILFQQNYNTANPSALQIIHEVDPAFGNDTTDELIASVEHELMPNFSVGASYIWKHLHDQSSVDAGIFAVGVSSSDFVARTLTAACGNGTCDQPSYTVTYFELPFLRPSGRMLKNVRWERYYDGVELVARKRFDDRWMLSGSITLNDTHIEYKDADAYQDPTNVALRNGAQTGTLNTRWVGKLSGLYVFPKDIELSAFYNFRDGVPQTVDVLTPTRAGGIGIADVEIRSVGEDRHPNFHQVDLRIGKTLALPRNQRLVASVDVFNLFNENTILDAIDRQNASNANQPTEILAPRVIRFGLRYTF